MHFNGHDDVELSRATDITASISTARHSLKLKYSNANDFVKIVQILFATYKALCSLSISLHERHSSVSTENGPYPSRTMWQESQHGSIFRQS